MLDGALVVKGNPVATGTQGSVTFTVHHGAYADSGNDQGFAQSIRGGGTYLIGNGWGPAGRGLVEHFRDQLDAARAAGNAEDAEAVLGPSLAVLSANWIAEVNAADAINDRLAATTTLLHHQIGIAGYDRASYVDLPGNVIGVVNQSADTDREDAAFFSAAMHRSILESAAVEQTSGVSAVSTVKLIDLAAEAGMPIYDARSDNYASIKGNLVACNGWLNTFDQAIASGYRLILPQHCDTKGHFLYAHRDLSVGVGAFPASLDFQRLYSSGLRTRDGPLGKGWTHNLAIEAHRGCDGFQGLGEDSALDAVGAIVETLVALDLMGDPDKPLDKLVIATLGGRWFGDRLLDNTVVVRQGLNGEVFVKLPDATFNAPPGNPAKLVENPNGSYSALALHNARIDFDASGRIASYADPGGIQVRFSYTGSALSGVANSLGRSLDLSYRDGRLASVSDGTRTVGYGYGTTGDLTTFTDAAGKTTRYQYDLHGRLTQVFLPEQPRARLRQQRLRQPGPGPDPDRP